MPRRCGREGRYLAVIGLLGLRRDVGDVQVAAANVGHESPVRAVLGVLLLAARPGQPHRRRAVHRQVVEVVAVHNQGGRLVVVPVESRFAR